MGHTTAPAIAPAGTLTGILDRAGIEQHVRGPVMRLIPGLIEFVTQAEVERELGDALKSSCAYPAVRHCRLPTMPMVEPSRFSETRSRIKSAGPYPPPPVVTFGLLVKVAVVVEVSQEPEIGRVEIVLLIAGRLHSKRQQVPAPLPCQVVVVVESIVTQDLRVGVGPEVLTLKFRSCSEKPG